MHVLRKKLAYSCLKNNKQRKNWGNLIFPDEIII